MIAELTSFQLFGAQIIGGTKPPVVLPKAEIGARV